jgi:hypothetical protein
MKFEITRFYDETRKFLGIDEGKPVPREELVAQLEAEGYADADEKVDLLLKKGEFGTAGARLVTDGGEAPRAGYDTPQILSFMKDAENGDMVLVVHLPTEKRAGGFKIDETRTVADANPDHPKDAPVVNVVYPEEVREKGYDMTDPQEICKNAVLSGDLTTYAFPTTRLEYPYGGELNGR